MVNEDRPQNAGSSEGPAPVLATDLTGNLPCIGCGYDLKGLSVRALCPECGVAVRATILACVDPMAEELRPVRRPALVAYGLIVWAWAAVVAAGSVWAQRLADVMGIWVVIPNGLSDLALGVGIVCIALSGLAALVLVRPFAGENGSGAYKAAGAVLMYIPLLTVHYVLLGVFDTNTVGVPFIGEAGIDPDRALLRLAENMIIIVIVLGLRDNAVALAERSIVMRTGRVDTQPMTALVGTLVLVSAADVLRLVFGGVNGTAGDLLGTLELIIIAVGSFLFTLGLTGVGFDVLRLRPVLLSPSPGLADVMAERGESDDDS